MPCDQNTPVEQSFISFHDILYWIFIFGAITGLPVRFHWEDNVQELKKSVAGLMWCQNVLTGWRFTELTTHP